MEIEREHYIRKYSGMMINRHNYELVIRDTEALNDLPARACEHQRGEVERSISYLYAVKGQFDSRAPELARQRAVEMLSMRD